MNSLFFIASLSSALSNNVPFYNSGIIYFSKTYLKLEISWSVKRDSLGEVVSL
jgi:hypothetical protein